MVSSVSDILLKNNMNYPTNLPANELRMYLYGLPEISPAENCLILAATIKFVKDTNRFTPVYTRNNRNIFVLRYTPGDPAAVL